MAASPQPIIASPASVKRSRGIGPALALFFTAPLVAEFLLGDLPVSLLPALIVLAPMYGGGALLIRESARRWARGWPTILMLGMAFALLEEAFTTQSLFNPDYLHLHLNLLQPAYIPALGIGARWTLWMLNVHPIWSIAVPIALIEASVPRRSQTPWLGPAGYIVLCIVFAAGLAAMTRLTYRGDHFTASPLQFTCAGIVTLLLIVSAFLLPQRPAPNPPPSNLRPPSYWVTGILALAAGSAALLIPLQWGWWGFAANLALDLLMLFTVLTWSRRPHWTSLHTLSLAAGATLAYAWHSFIQLPVVGKPDLSLRLGDALFSLAAIGLITLAARRTAKAEAVSPQTSS